MKDSIKDWIIFENIGNKLHDQVIIEHLEKRIGNLRWKLKAEKYSSHGKDYLSLKIAYIPNRNHFGLSPQITVKSRIIWTQFTPEISISRDSNEIGLGPNVWMGKDKFCELDELFYGRLSGRAACVEVDVQVISLKCREPVNVMNLFDPTGNTLWMRAKNWEREICCSKVLILHHCSAFSKGAPRDVSCRSEITGGVDRLAVCNFIQLINGCWLKLNHRLAYRMLDLAVTQGAPNVFRYCEQYFISSGSDASMEHMGYYGCDRYMIHFLKKVNTLEELKEMTEEWVPWIDRWKAKILKVIARKFFSFCDDE